MQVNRIMSANPKCCTPDMTIQQAAQMMIDCNCGAIPVVQSNENQHPVGIITDRDIACRAVAAGKDPTKTKVSDCMTSQIECVKPEASIEECCNKMEEAQVRRLLVADGDGTLCGIVSQADVALHSSQRKTAEVVKKVSEPTAVASSKA